MISTCIILLLLEVVRLVSCFFYISPSGKLVQIEYALQAVATGAPSVGIKGIIITNTVIQE